jgi:hypothetical protein
MGAMPVKKLVPGSAQGVLPVKGDIIETLWTEDNKDGECGNGSLWKFYWATWVSYRPGKRSAASGI